MNHFKTQQEIWKYVADGGAVTTKEGEIVRFENEELNIAYNFNLPSQWKPYIEPKCICGEINARNCSVHQLEATPKTKVWRWEKVIKNQGEPFVDQTKELYTEADATKFLPDFTKVAGSEREV